MLSYGVSAMLVMKAKNYSAHNFATYSNICHKLTVVTVKSLNDIYRKKVSSKSTALNTDKISLPCVSTYCLTAPEDHVKVLFISTDTSFICLLIFLSLYWESLPSVLLLTPRSIPTIIYTFIASHFDIRGEISVFRPYSSWKTIAWERVANFEQHLWDSFCLNFLDFLFSKQMIEDTTISQFWFDSKAFPDTVKIIHHQLHLVGNVSVNSKPDHPLPGRPSGIRTFQLPQGSGFRPPLLSGSLPGGLK